MNTIDGGRTYPSHRMMRDAMRQLHHEFPNCRCWPLLGVNGHITWVGLIEEPAPRSVNDNHQRHR